MKKLHSEQERTKQGIKLLSPNIFKIRQKKIATYDKELGEQGFDIPKDFKAELDTLAEIDPVIWSALQANNIYCLNDIRQLNPDELKYCPLDGNPKTKKYLSKAQIIMLEDFVSHHGGWFFKDHQNPKKIINQIKKSLQELKPCTAYQNNFTPLEEKPPVTETPPELTEKPDQKKQTAPAPDVDPVREASAPMDPEEKLKKRTSEKLTELLRKNIVFITTPLKDLRKYFKPNSTIMKLQGRENLDYMMEVLVLTKEELLEMGMDEFEIIEIDEELAEYDFQLDMPALAREIVEHMDTQEAREAESRRMELKLDRLLQEHGLR